MLKKYTETLERCTICHDQCAFSCPVFVEDRRTTVYPSRKAQVARAVLRGELPYDEETTRLFYQCTSCRLCWRWCVYLKDRKDIAPALRAARAEAVSKGVLLPEVASLAERTRNEGTPWGNLTDQYAQLAKKAPSDGPKKLFLFADAATLALNPKAFRAFFVLANAANYAVQLSTNILTGFELADIGISDMADAIRTSTYEEITDWFGSNDAGPIVTLNPQVAYALNRWYSEEGLTISGEVLTHSAFLAHLLEGDKLQFKPSPKSVALQDSAYQARYLEDIESPRLILKAAFSDLREPNPSGIESNPLSPEGLAPELSLKVKKEMPRRRLRELMETNAQLIVTLDPYSYVALASVAGDEVMCLDIAQALAVQVEDH